MAVIVPWPVRGTKKCSGPCGRTLPYDLDEPENGVYTIVKRKRKGGINRAPYHMCRRCKADEVAAYKAEHLEEVRRKRRAWYAGLAQEKRDERREYAREYAIARAREAGVQPRRFKKARRTGRAPTTEAERRARRRVPVAPFLDWLDEWQALTGRDDAWVAAEAASQLGILEESARRYLRRLRSGEIQAMGRDLRLAAAVATAAGMPEQVDVLYPPE